MELIFSAKTVQQAVEKACEELALDLESINYEVIDEGKKSLFGGKDAVIKVLSSDKCARVREFMEKLVKSFPLNDVEVEVTENNSSLSIELIGEEASYLIGRRGETLNSLQYLAGLVANNGGDKYARVSLNINGYREKREKTLEGLARRLSKQALRTGRSVSLEPMAPYERRIIHATVQNIEGVSSTSVGEEPHRKVVISCDNPKPRRDRRDNRKKSQPKEKVSYEASDSLIKDDFLTSSSTIEGLKKERELKEASLPLYSKIELD